MKLSYLSLKLLVNILKNMVYIFAAAFGIVVVVVVVAVVATVVFNDNLYPYMVKTYLPAYHR